MVRIIAIDDAADDRLVEFTRLRDMSLRKRLETDRGIFIAEGEKVLRRAIQAGHPARSFLMAPRWLEPLADLLATTDAPCYVMAEPAIENVTGFHVHRGALAALERPEPRTVESVLAGARRVVVTEDLADHANVGAIIRTAAALGFDAILLSPRCADPLYRRAIKVSMGAVFRLPWARVDDWYALPDLLREHGFVSYAMTLADDSLPLDSIEPAERSALIVGSEGHGLTPRWESGADHRVTIPMATGIDSLNVAASVAIACWQFRPR